MQSGKANVQYWLMEPLAESDARFIDPVIGWTSSNDTTQQLRLKFPTKEAAIEYATQAGHDYVVTEPKQPRFVKKSYAENFQ